MSPAKSSGKVSSKLAFAACVSLSLIEDASTVVTTESLKFEVSEEDIVMLVDFLLGLC